MPFSAADDLPRDAEHLDPFLETAKRHTDGLPLPEFPPALRLADRQAKRVLHSISGSVTLWATPAGKGLPNAWLLS